MGWGWRFGLSCDTTNGNNQVDKDVAVHAYIMGFRYEPDAGSTGQFLAASASWGNSAMSADSNL